MEIDHLAVTCASLEQGVAWTEAALGTTLRPGGQHARYGTHNRLLGLGPGLYLEVIAPDPAVPPPPYPRWFGLDRVAAPALGNWIVRTTRLSDVISGLPIQVGEPVSLSRGDLSWTIAVPKDGSLPLQGGFPTLIEWTSGQHPAMRLPDCGLRLTRLEVRHPEAARISDALQSHLPDPRLIILQSESVCLRAAFATPMGERWLG